jgi:hypothetical protein
MDLLQLALTYAGDLIAAASVVVGGVAMITKITPNTKDDEIITTLQAIIKKAQRIFGAIAIDSGAVSKTVSRKKA